MPIFKVLNIGGQGTELESVTTPLQNVSSAWVLFYQLNYPRHLMPFMKMFVILQFLTLRIIPNKSVIGPIQ